MPFPLVFDNLVWDRYQFWRRLKLEKCCAVVLKSRTFSNNEKNRCPVLLHVNFRRMGEKGDDGSSAWFIEC